MKKYPNCGTEIVSVLQKKEIEKENANKKKRKIVIIIALVIVVSMVGVVAYQHLPFSGGKKATFSFITYTEPYADEKEIDEEGDIWYNFGKENTDNRYSLGLTELNYYDSVEDAEIDIENENSLNEDGSGFTNAREVTVDGHNAVRLDFVHENNEVLMEQVEFANEATRVAVEYFPAKNKKANKEGEKAFKELLNSIRYK